MENILTVNKKRVTLIGPIDSGKTTLLHRLIGIILLSPIWPLQVIDLFSFL